MKIKQPKITLLGIIFIIVAILGIGVIASGAEIQPDGQETTQSEEKVTLNTNDWKTYTIPESGASFKYPDYFKIQRPLALIKSPVALVKRPVILTTTVCWDSDNCNDSFQNLRIYLYSIGEFEYKENEKKYNNSDYSAREILIDGIKGFSYIKDTDEGKGTIYYIAPFNQFKNVPTNFIARLEYINENILTHYKGVKDFIDFEKQKQIMDTIISTYKFSKKDQNIEVQNGFIKRLYEESGKRYMDIDYIQFFQGKEAKEEGDSAPNDYFIINENPKIRSFEISDDAEITVVKINRIETQKESWIKSHVVGGRSTSIVSYIVTYDELKSLRQIIDSYPYDITIKDNKIIEITEWYIP